MELKKLQASIEAVLFAYAEPLPVSKLAEVIGAEAPLVEKLLWNLRDELKKEEHGIQLIQLEGAWQFASKSEYSAPVKAALDTRRNVPLSPAALEVLAIIAYNQPVSRSFVEQVRGVDSSSTVYSLAQKGLIEEKGRLDLPGKPIAYGTTDAFLRTFGISSLTELPPLHSEEEQEHTQEAEMFTPTESDLKALSQEGEDNAEELEETQALRGGMFIEGEGGSAEFMGQDE